ncbi:MAG: phosphate signaling complex protein PhoU [Dehalococcoidia bacterium]|mgnify:CR=1 FL=1|nr:phosphate signaling complex protein PhoU [Dehalococcoidia bacterium]HRC61669.1 phosphate signaling complex protein PhoU [Dehalococcoidia bacterium]
MSREQFHKGLQGLQDGVLEMGSMVDRQIERSMQALINRDVPLAEAVIRDDVEVNRSRFHLDNICLSLLAMQAPMASDLRLIVSVLSMITDLERMGDHAEGIARIVLLMRDEPLVKPLVDIPAMANTGRVMLKEVLDALVQRDEEAAYRVGAMDDEVDVLYERVYHDLIGIMIKDQSTVEACTHLLWIAHNLERIADRCTNIAERVVFTKTGMLPEMDISTY